MSEIKKLYYIATVRLPTEKAHGIQIMKTCEALVLAGVEIELIVPKRQNYITENAFAYYNIDSKLFQFQELNVVDFIDTIWLGSFGYWLTGWLFFRSLLKKIKISLSDTIYTRDLTLAYWLSKRGFSVFYEIHTLPQTANYFYKKTWERCRGIIVISEGLKSELIKRNVQAQKIVIARDGVDVQKFSLGGDKNSARTKLNLPINKKIVLYTGHLYEWKGAHLLADAAKIISNDVEVYIVGGREFDILNFRKNYGGIANLHIIGWQPSDSMPMWQKAADFLVLPNSAKDRNSSTYTSPLKVFEYMMSGNHIIASDVPALREVLNDTQATFFKPDDSIALAEAVEKASTFPVTEANGVMLKEKCEKEYTWNARAQKISSFIFGNE